MTKVDASLVPVLSMTGFGSGTASFGGRSFRVEIRTLNHRGLDVKLRAQDCVLSPELESDVYKKVRSRIVRGSVLISIKNEARNRRANGIDADSIKRLHSDLKAVQSSLGLDTPITLNTIGVFYSASIGNVQEEISASDWENFLPALESAMSGVLAMRANEGAALATDLLGRVTTLRALTSRMRDSSAALPSRVLQRLRERLAALDTQIPGLDPSRLAQELAMIAEKFDVNEELVRLSAHLDQLEGLLTAKRSEPQGRRIEFLAQEIGREINTIGSKVQDSVTTISVVDAKVELEKLKEQSQNIE